jgi:hexosaminidase
MNDLIPLPVAIMPTGGQFVLTANTHIYVEAGSAELTAIGQYLADILGPATGYKMRVVATTEAPASGNVYLTTRGDADLGEEGYELTITSELLALAAYRPAGLFRGLQTIRQLLPPEIESATRQPGPWQIETAVIRDYPRFAWRGVMLDVARHFFHPDVVKRYLDLAAYYKLNSFHLHLSDDQGWRLMINAWPKLATHGGSTEVGNGGGGYYTQADYADLVAYAQSRYVAIVPEIDMPGHTHAALASYAELGRDEKAPPLYTGTDVGFSSLCIDKDITYTFVQDVLGELAALTPAPYIHIGGDEAKATAIDDYRYFVKRLEAIVQATGKHMIGWEEIAQIDLNPSSIVQFWDHGASRAAVQEAVRRGTRLIMSPAPRTYLDMKYDVPTLLGLEWAGRISVEQAYNWDPAAYLDDVPESQVLGLEAPLWSETLKSLSDIEWMAFPRLLGHAEIGWSPVAPRHWDEYRLRLGAHGPRLAAMNVNFCRVPQVAWQ